MKCKELTNWQNKIIIKNIKDERDRTDAEKEWHNVWQDVRTDILNNGNNQLRACTNEISQYTMTWDRYKTDFIVTKN